MNESLDQIKEALGRFFMALIQGLEEVNQGVKFALDTSIPEFIEYFIRFVHKWAGLLFVIGVIVVLIDCTLFFLMR